MKSGPPQETTADTSTMTLKSSKSASTAKTWVPPNQRKTIYMDDIMKEDETQQETHEPEPQVPLVSHLPEAQKEEISRVYKEKILNQKEYDVKHSFLQIDVSTINRVFLAHFRKFLKWRCPEWVAFLKDRVPVLNWITKYDWKHSLVLDIIGGLIVSCMSIPQGLAYGLLVGLNPIFGLYTGIFGPLIYVFLGTSRHVSPGAFAILALMVGTVVEQATNVSNNVILHGTEESYLCCGEAHSKVAMDERQEKVNLAIVSCVTLLTGLIQIILGLLNAGVLAVWLSDHLVFGLTSGAAIHVLTSQLKTMTGIPNLPPTSDVNGIIKFYICFFGKIGEVHTPTLYCSLICVFLLIYSKEYLDKVLGPWIKIKFPMELLIVVFSILMNYFSADTDMDFGLSKVGNVESGLYAAFPRFDYFDQVYSSAISIAIISFVIHIALAKLIAKKEDYSINSNQEWLALGAMNAIGSCFGCFAGGSSLSRSMTQQKLGTKSQLSTFFCAITLIGVVFGLAQYFYYLPKPVLACIVVVALKDLFVQIYHSAKILPKSFIDFMIWFVTFFSVVVINLNIGLVIGITFALLTVIFRTQWPRSIPLGRIPGTMDFKVKLQYRDSEDIEGIFIMRFDAPLYFANCELFLEQLRKPFYNPLLLKENVKRNAAKKEANQNGNLKEHVEVVYHSSREVRQPSKFSEKNAALENGIALEEKEYSPSHIVIDCSTFLYVDLMGLETLMQTYKEFADISIKIYFANCLENVRQFLELNSFFEKVEKTNFFASIWDAVNQAQKDRIEDVDKKAEKDRKVKEDAYNQTQKDALNQIQKYPKTKEDAHHNQAQEDQCAIEKKDEICLTVELPQALIAKEKSEPDLPQNIEPLKTMQHQKQQEKKHDEKPETKENGVENAKKNSPNEPKTTTKK